MEKKTASEEAINRMYNSMGANIELQFSSLCTYIDAIRQLKVSVSQNNSDHRAELLLIILEIKAFVITMQLDLFTFLRADFRAKHPCEKRINLKYVNVSILEGCKYIQGFGKDAKNSKLSVLQRVGQANDDRELSTDISSLRNSLNAFLKQYNNLNDKTNRDLALHYDQDPLKVYDFLEQISEEVECGRVVRWFDILAAIMQVTDKYIKKYNSILPQNSVCPNVDLDIYKQINIFPDENSNIFNSMEEIVKSYSGHLDSIVERCRLFEKINKKTGSEFQVDTSTISQSYQSIIKGIYPGIHIHYIYLDLACAFKAYFSSELFIERQFNLRRITVILYDGFSHIYGYNLEQQNQSFWKGIHSNLQNNDDIETAARVIKVQNILDELSKDKFIYNPTLRECFIHYRKGNVDNVIKLYEETIKAFPMFEMAKALKLLNILPEIIKLNMNVLSGSSKIIKEDAIKTRNETMSKIRSLIDFSHTPEQKQKLQADFDKIEDILSKFNK